MKLSTWPFSALAVMSASIALAHSDHAPPPKAAVCKAAECTKDEVTEGTAATIIPMMIEKGKIDATWRNLKANSAEQKQFKKGKEWVVTFKNDKVTDKAKQVLYVFVTLDGTLTGANFTGQ